MKYISLFLIVFSVSVMPVHAQKKILTIGSGGGFSGAATVYKIAENGKVWRGKGLGEIAFTECSKIRAKKAKAFINKSIQVAAATPMSSPGNMYYFISVLENGKENKITWGDADHPAPEAIKNLYKDIQTAVSDLKYKPVK